MHLPQGTVHINKCTPPFIQVTITNRSVFDKQSIVWGWCEAKEPEGLHIRCARRLWLDEAFGTRDVPALRFFGLAPFADDRLYIE